MGFPEIIATDCSQGVLALTWHTSISGGSHILKAYGDVPPGLLLHQKSLDMGPHFGPETLKKRVPFHRNSKKVVKSAVFNVENP